MFTMPEKETPALDFKRFKQWWFWSTTTLNVLMSWVLHFYLAIPTPWPCKFWPSFSNIDFPKSNSQPVTLTQAATGQCLCPCHSSTWQGFCICHITPYWEPESDHQERLTKLQHISNCSKCYLKISSNIQIYSDMYCTLLTLAGWTMSSEDHAEELTKRIHHISDLGPLPISRMMTWICINCSKLITY